MKRPLITVQWEDAPVPENYTEAGNASGEKLEQHRIANPDLLRIYEATRDMSPKQGIQWIDDHLQSFEDSTVIVDTDDGNALLPLRRLEPELIINKRTLNKIRHLNTFLGRANEVLEAGGYFWCFVRTAALKKELLLKAYPKGINYLMCLLHWFWHRFCAKMPLLRDIYFGITQGRDRSYSRVEVLGRMYRAGFEVIDEQFRHGRLFVLCRKSKAPVWDVEPACGPLIKLARVGKNGKIIHVYKFRTMYSYSEYLQPYVYTHEGLQDGGKFKQDYRVTLWGRFMRRTWLDELPMILNFLKGDLKLVGVRPLSRHYFSLYTPELQALRVKVKPGLLPPFYYEKETPKTLENVMESEARYLNAYLAHPLRTDWRYFWGSVGNILFRHKKSN